MADGLEGLPVATLICDPQGQILLANRKARDLFGGELRGAELRQRLAELGHPSLPVAPAQRWKPWKPSSSATTGNATCASTWRACCRSKAKPPSAGW